MDPAQASDNWEVVSFSDHSGNYRLPDDPYERVSASQHAVASTSGSHLASGSQPGRGSSRHTSANSRRSNQSEGEGTRFTLPDVANPSRELTSGAFGSQSFAGTTREQERQRYLQGIKSAVSADIQRVLSSSKAYVKHVQGPPVMSHSTLVKLAVPRQSLLHPENQAGFADPIAYAQWKAEQLEQQRRVNEGQQALLRSEREDRQHRLAAYQTWKAEQERLKEEQKAAEEREKQQYSKELAGYVQERARRQLAGLREKRHKELEKGAALHSAAMQRDFLVGRRGHQKLQEAAEVRALKT